MFSRLFKSEHQRIEELLSAYLDGELSLKEQARAEKHLTQCADCARNLDTLRQTVTLVRQLPPVAVPRAFTIRPDQVAQPARSLQMGRAYGYLRGATALATLLLIVVLAGDAFLVSLPPSWTPDSAPEGLVQSVPAEKVVRGTVVLEREVPVTLEVEREVIVEKEAMAEKKVIETIVVEKEVLVEKEVVVEAPVEAPALESRPAFEGTPMPAAPAEDRTELTRAPRPLLAPPTLETQETDAAAPPSAAGKEVEAEALPHPSEERIEAAPVAGAAAGVTATPEPAFAPAVAPTAVAEAPFATPALQRTTAPATARLSDFGLTLLRVVEISLLVLVLALAIATLVARRRQAR